MQVLEQMGGAALLPTRAATDITRRGIQFVRSHARKPFFLWLHYFDPHAPYEPPEPWRSRWYANKRDFAENLIEDQKIRRFIFKEWQFAAIPKVEIERAGELVTVFVHTARPGVLIGKKGTKVDEFRQSLEKLTKKPVRMKIIEIHRPELEAKLVAEGVAEQEAGHDDEDQCAEGEDRRGSSGRITEALLEPEVRGAEGDREDDAPDEDLEERRDRADRHVQEHAEYTDADHDL